MRLDPELVEQAAHAVLAANDHAHCRKRNVGGRRAFGRETFAGPTADQLLQDGADFSQDSTLYRDYIEAVFRRAKELNENTD